MLFLSSDIWDKEGKNISPNLRVCACMHVVLNNRIKEERFELLIQQKSKIRAAILNWPTHQQYPIKIIYYS